MAETADNSPCTTSRSCRVAQLEENRWLVMTRIEMNPLFVYDMETGEEKMGPVKHDTLWQQISEKYRQHFPTYVPKTPMDLRAKWARMLKRYRRDCRAVVAKTSGYEPMPHFTVIDTYFRSQADADYQCLMRDTNGTLTFPAETNAPPPTVPAPVVTCLTCVVPLCRHSADTTDPRSVRFIRLMEAASARRECLQLLQLPYCGKTHELYICTEHFDEEDVDVQALVPVRPQAMPTRKLPENVQAVEKQLPVEGNTAFIDDRMQKYVKNQWKILSLYRHNRPEAEHKKGKAVYKNRSPVWEHFTPAQGPGNVCNHCNKLFLANTTTTLLDHVRRFHFQYLSDDAKRQRPKRIYPDKRQPHPGHGGACHSFESELKLVELVAQHDPFGEADITQAGEIWIAVIQDYNDSKVEDKPLNYRACRSRLKKLMQASQLHTLPFRPRFHLADPAALTHLDTLLHTLHTTMTTTAAVRAASPIKVPSSYTRRSKGSDVYHAPDDGDPPLPRLRALVKCPGKLKLSCVVAACPSRVADQKRLGVTMHRCLRKPRAEEGREKERVYERWVRAIGMESGQQWDERCYICSRHFKEEMMDKLGGLGRKLKKGAYPVKMLRAVEFAEGEGTDTYQRTKTDDLPNLKFSTSTKSITPPNKPDLEVVVTEDSRTTPEQEEIPLITEETVEPNVTPPPAKRQRPKWSKRSSETRKTAPTGILDILATADDKPAIRSKRKRKKVEQPSDDVDFRNGLPEDAFEALPQLPEPEKGLWDEVSALGYKPAVDDWTVVKRSDNAVTFARTVSSLSEDAGKHCVVVHKDLTVSVYTDSTVVPQNRLGAFLDARGRLRSRNGLCRLLSLDFGGFSCVLDF